MTRPILVMQLEQWQELRIKSGADAAVQVYGEICDMRPSPSPSPVLGVLDIFAFRRKLPNQNLVTHIKDFTTEDGPFLSMRFTHPTHSYSHLPKSTSSNRGRIAAAAAYGGTDRSTSNSSQVTFGRRRPCRTTTLAVC
jgi:hypothetical protein